MPVVGSQAGELWQLNPFMDRLPNVSDLTAEELKSLVRTCSGFIGRTIPRAHEKRLVELGLIQSMMGGLMATPAGRMVARAV